MRISRALARMRAALAEPDREPTASAELEAAAPPAAMPRSAMRLLRTRAAPAPQPTFAALRDDLPSALRDRLTALAASLG